MRIFAGALKGMKLLAPKDASTTRPTSAKIREAILHKVSSDLESALFIDLFSGTGAVGLEAISRGAEGAYLVENNRNTLRILKKNLAVAKERMAKQGFSPKPFDILPLDATKALKKIIANKPKLPIVVWADPPYAMVLPWLQELNKDLSILESVSLFILESDLETSQEKDFELKGWNKAFDKNYGSTAITAWTPAS